jgi:hypothetical protein
MFFLLQPGHKFGSLHANERRRIALRFKVSYMLLLCLKVLVDCEQLTCSWGCVMRIPQGSRLQLALRDGSNGLMNFTRLAGGLTAPIVDMDIQILFECILLYSGFMLNQARHHLITRTLPIVSQDKSSERRTSSCKIIFTELILSFRRSCLLHSINFLMLLLVHQPCSIFSKGKLLATTLLSGWCSSSFFIDISLLTDFLPILHGFEKKNTSTS